MTYRGLITIRYMLGLALIACVLFGSFMLMDYQITRKTEYAQIINISGMQRMLSQRIAFIAQHLEEVDTPQEIEHHRHALRDAINRLEDNQQFLNSREQFQDNPDLRQLYDGDAGVNARLDELTENAKRLLYGAGQPEWAPTQTHPIVTTLSDIAYSALLPKLNAIVYVYQGIAEQSLAEFRKTEMLMFGTGLFVLLLEALFIFRPLANQVERKTQELEKHNQELTEFSYRISHDLRAPIVSSQGLVHIAKTALGSGKSAKTEKALEHMGDSLQKLNALVEDVLHLMRMKFAADDNLEEVDLADLYQQSFEKLQHLPNTQHIEFVTEISVTQKLVCKRIYVQQIIENLLSNAVKYYDPSTQQPRVTFIAKMERDALQISVRDNGIGIPEEAREKLFGMFERFHPNTSFGTGLGLYMVQQNAQRIGGEVTFIAPEKGAEFRLTIPKAKVV